VLLATENRSVLAYDIVPQRNRPVMVAIASETGWSLVGVMGSAQLDSAGAIALISARGLDAAGQPLASKSAAAGEQSVLGWLGETRTPEQRQVAKLRAGARPLVPGAKAAPPKKDEKKRLRRPAVKSVSKTIKAKSVSKSKGRATTSRSKTKKGGRR
jgi:hypothetical protein